MQRETGVLGRTRRRWAWLTFVLMLGYAPLMAYVVNGPLALYTIPHDTWMLSVTVAGLVGFVLIVDDVERRKALRQAALEPPSSSPADN